MPWYIHSKLVVMQVGWDTDIITRLRHYIYIKLDTLHDICPSLHYTSFRQDLVLGTGMVPYYSSGTPAKKQTIPHYLFWPLDLGDSPQLRTWGHFNSHHDGILLVQKLWTLSHCGLVHKIPQIVKKSTNCGLVDKSPQIPQIPRLIGVHNKNNVTP
jgi:hypothetical protein